MGDQPVGERVSAGPVVADTFAGCIHVEWDSSAAVTPLGQLPFFVKFVKQGGLFDGLVADCPLDYTSPNVPRRRDVLGTTFLSVLAGHWRYAHMTTVRCDPVNPPLLRMTQVVSEDAVQGGLARRQGQRIILQRDLLNTLRRRALDAAGAKLSVETGLPYAPTAGGARMAGTYRRRLTLNSGRFAMIDNGCGSESKKANACRGDEKHADTREVKHEASSAAYRFDLSSERAGLAVRFYAGCTM